MESASWVKGAYPAHQEPSLGWESGLGTQEMRAGGDLLGMHRLVPAWGKLLSSLCPYQCRGCK